MDHSTSTFVDVSLPRAFRYTDTTKTRVDESRVNLSIIKPRGQEAAMMSVSAVQSSPLSIEDTSRKLTHAHGNILVLQIN
jgi:hypothetical protein